MKIKTFTLGPLQTNCYLVYDEASRETIIIDPADDGTFISEQIIELQLKPKYIVLTHAHLDHIMGLLEVKLNFDVPILMHKADQFLLESLPQRAQHWLKREVFPAPPADRFLTENNQLSIGNSQLRVLETPGHTPGSICLLSQRSERDFSTSVEMTTHNSQPILLSGDTLFANAIGRYDFSYSDYGKLQKSLKKLMDLPDDTIVYPGHGEATTIGEERKNLNFPTL